MGIPRFSKWLYGKYPKTISNAIDQSSVDNKLNLILPDASEDNPNGIEFDNFYIDMNGLVHPCCHPEDAPQPKDEAEMLKRVNEYTLYLMSIVRPRKLLYIALDGVAPRAKMNQQRSRRFKAAQERVEADKIAAGPKKWDHNVITPGTPFMAKLSLNIKTFIREQLARNKAWSNLKVVFSDSNVPGEGEHKIMAYIRKQRQMPGYDPNLRHCVHGLDADLFMLSLATHELRFSLLRENVFTKTKRSVCCEACGSKRHTLANCQTKRMNSRKGNPRKKFQFAHIYILREYLEKELFTPNLKNWDLERAIDDFIFLCFFVGNDFLPHLPALQIKDGAIDMLMAIYKVDFLPYNVYLTENGEIKMENLKKLLQIISKVEKALLVNDENNRRHFERMRRSKEEQRRNAMASKSVEDLLALTGVRERRQKTAKDFAQTETRSAFKKRVRSFMGGITPPSDSANKAPNIKRSWIKRLLKFIIGVKLDTVLNAESDNHVPEEEHLELQLNKSDWRLRYYRLKFGGEFDPDAPADMFLRILSSYLTGLQWVFSYYISESCPSWKWFYPQYFAPLAGDLACMASAGPAPARGEPLGALEQLMAVMPPASRHCLPEPLAELMVCPDSGLADFYPEEFRVDLDRKRFVWEGVALLPFIDEERLLAKVRPKIAQLSKEERALNASGPILIFVRRDGPFADQLNLGEAKGRFVKKVKTSTPDVFCGKFKATKYSRSESVEGILCMEYKLPTLVNPSLKNRLLPGAKKLSGVLSGNDFNVKKWRFGSFNVARDLKNAGMAVMQQFRRYDLDCRSMPWQTPFVHRQKMNCNDFGRAFRVPSNRPLASPPFVRRMPCPERHDLRNLRNPNQRAFSQNQNFRFGQYRAVGRPQLPIRHSDRKKRYSRMPRGVKYRRVGI